MKLRLAVATNESCIKLSIPVDEEAAIKAMISQKAKNDGDNVLLGLIMNIKSTAQATNNRTKAARFVMLLLPNPSLTRI